MRLLIDEIVARAERLEDKVRRTLPDAQDLHQTARGVVAAAGSARDRVNHWKGPFSLSKVRIYVIAAAALWLGGWFYANYLQNRTITIAAPRADSALLRERAERKGARFIRFQECAGSIEGIEHLTRKLADLAVVQGGIELPPDFRIVGSVRQEHVLYFEKPDFPPAGRAPRVITFNPDQGSHRLARRFFTRWGYDSVKWIHAWGRICSGEEPVPEADAVFVVVDPADPATLDGIRRVTEAGFGLRDPNLGIYARNLPYLQRIELSAGDYLTHPPLVPAGAGSRTYAVDSFLVASPHATDWQLERAAAALDARARSEEGPVALFHTEGTSLVADLAALMEATVNVVIVLATLFGLEILLHRKCLHELNNMISRISLLQADRDLAVANDPAVARQTMLYLDFCGDLLGLISTLAGYYAQENAALLFNGLTATIHSRSNELKINVQLKLMQGIERLKSLPPEAPPTA